MRKWVRVVVGAAISAVLVAGASQVMLAAGAEAQKKVKKTETKSLYERLGKKEAITAVVEEFVANVAADTRINTFFAHTDIPHLKTELVDQICQATGGPCKYTGKTMKEAHQGMGVSTADFTALVEDLVKALDKFHVGAKEKDELLSALGSMKGDIVEKL